MGDRLISDASIRWSARLVINSVERECESFSIFFIRDVLLNIGFIFSKDYIDFFVEFSIQEIY